MKLRRSIFVVGALAMTFLVVFHPPHAFACSCAQFTEEDAFESADIVFIGDVVSRTDPNEGNEVQGSGDPIQWRFDVRSTQKGSPNDPQTVESARDGATCGYGFRVGKRYQVYAEKQGSKLTTGLCSGNKDLGAGAAYHPPEDGRKLPATGVPLPWVVSTIVGVATAAGVGVLWRRKTRIVYGESESGRLIR